MAIDDWNSIWICDRYLVGRNSDKLAILLVAVVDSKISPTPTALVHVPEVRELR